MEKDERGRRAGTGGEEATLLGTRWTPPVPSGGVAGQQQPKPGWDAQAWDAQHGKDGKVQREVRSTDEATEAWTPGAQAGAVGHTDPGHTVEGLQATLRQLDIALHDREAIQYFQEWGQKNGYSFL